MNGSAHRRVLFFQTLEELRVKAQATAEKVALVETEIKTANGHLKDIASSLKLFARGFVAFSLFVAIIIILALVLVSNGPVTMKILDSLELSSKGQERTAK